MLLADKREKMSPFGGRICTICHTMCVIPLLLGYPYANIFLKESILYPKRKFWAILAKQWK